MQLCQSSFEILAAARAKHHISAKQHLRRDECNVIVEVAGNFDDIENRYPGRPDADDLLRVSHG